VRYREGRKSPAGAEMPQKIEKRGKKRQRRLREKRRRNPSNEENLTPKRKSVNKKGEKAVNLTGTTS